MVILLISERQVYMVIIFKVSGEVRIGYSMRLFIAINFNETTRARLIALRDDLRRKAISGRFSAPENLHLTLVFLGECDMAQAKRAEAAMDAVNFAPFPVTFDRIGRFGRDGGGLWWAGARGNEPLLNLHRDLTGKLAAGGFELEKRKYSPHVTLAREVVAKEPPMEIETFSETVFAIELMKSEHMHGKLKYTAIHEVRCRVQCAV